MLADKKVDVAAWQRELDQRNASKAAGVEDVGADEVAEFSSEDIIAYVNSMDISAILEAYRQRGGISDEAQEE